MNVTSSLSAWAKKTPSDPALVTGESSLSFAELDQAVSATAASFKKAGLVPGDIVGIRLSNQVRHFVTSLALARLGAGQVAFDASDPAPLQRELAGRLKIVAIVADRAEKNETGTPRIDPPTDNASDLKRLGPVKFKSANDGALPFFIADRHQFPWRKTARFPLRCLGRMCRSTPRSSPPKLDRFCCRTSYQLS